MDFLLPLLVGTAIGMLILWYQARTARPQCTELIEAYAKEHGATVESVRFRWNPLPPFAISGARQRKYDVVFVDPDGQRRKAVVRVGDRLKGWKSGHIDIAWR